MRQPCRCEWFLGRDFVLANSSGKVREFVFLSRLACIPLILIGGYFGMCFASQAYGEWPGITFATLWTFSPLFLGWGATLCPDMVATSLGIIAFYFFRRWLSLPTWKNVAIAGLFIGLLPLAKITWSIAFGLFPFLWLLSKNRPPMKQMAVVLLVALYMLNMGYLFDGSFRLLKDYTFYKRIIAWRKRKPIFRFGSRLCPRSATRRVRAGNRHAKTGF